MSESSIERCLQQANLCRTWGIASHTLIAAIEPNFNHVQNNGVPLSFVVKDSFSIENRPITFGLRPPLIAHCDESAAVVRRLQERGGVLLGIANLDEAALGSVGSNRYYGDVPNPRAPGFITGGSSSGCAAAVAAGCADIGIGTDWGGSVRIPAACCDVWGFKFSSQAVPREGVILYHEIHDTLGFIFDGIEVGLRGWRALVGNDVSKVSANSATVDFLSSDTFAEISPQDSEAYQQALDLLALDLPLVKEVRNVPFEESRRLRRGAAPEAVRSLLRVFPIDNRILPEQGRALLALADKNEKREADSESLLHLGGWLPKRCLVTPCFSRAYPIKNDSSNKVEAASSCTYFMELANVFDCPAVVIPKSIYGVALQIIGPKRDDAILWSILRSLRKRCP